MYNKGAGALSVVEGSSILSRNIKNLMKTIVFFSGGGVNRFAVAEVRRPPSRVNSILRQVDSETLRSARFLTPHLSEVVFLANSPRLT